MCLKGRTHHFNLSCVQKKMSASIFFSNRRYSAYISVPLTLSMCVYGEANLGIKPPMGYTLGEDILNVYSYASG